MEYRNIRGGSKSINGLSDESSRLVSGQIRSSINPDQHFCSIEYFDHEGDKVIKHAFLTIEEQRLLIEECSKSGISAKVYDLHPNAVTK